MITSRRAFLYQVVLGEYHSQLPMMEEYCKRNNCNTSRIYEEKEGEHKELTRLLRDCQKRNKPDVVLIWSLDRLSSRTGLIHLINLVVTLAELGVMVASCQEPWLEQNESLVILKWAADYESRVKSEGTKRGLLLAMGTGKCLGRPTGAKDRQPRKKRGYILRYANEETKRKHLVDPDRIAQHIKAGVRSYPQPPDAIKWRELAEKRAKKIVELQTVLGRPT